MLRELDKTWSEMEFEHDKHPRTGLTLLRASEELIETLEDNQVKQTRETPAVSEPMKIWWAPSLLGEMMSLCDIISSH